MKKYEELLEMDTKKIYSPREFKEDLCRELDVRKIPREVLEEYVLDDMWGNVYMMIYTPESFKHLIRPLLEAQGDVDLEDTPKK